MLLLLVLFKLGTLFLFSHSSVIDVSSVLHKNVQVIQMSGVETSKLEPWSPTIQEKNLNPDDLSKFREARRNGEIKFKEVPKQSNTQSSEHQDYLLKERPQSNNETNFINSESTPNIVELVIVCDKEWGDVFNHDRKKILDYWTIYFWDVNAAFRTLRRSIISFKINAIVVISDVRDQPFIEDSRAADGRTSHNRILDRFPHWIYAQLKILPKFDMVVAITNSHGEWGGGLAWVGTACWLAHDREAHWGAAVWNDNGNWGSRAIGAHEIAHVLGMHHDGDDYPKGCKVYSGKEENRPWFFSDCTDQGIEEFIRSPSSNCLRTIDEQEMGPELPQGFHTVKTPSMDDQCKLWSGNRNAEIGDYNCREMKCWSWDEGSRAWYAYSYEPLQNSPCQGGGRCFRGRCLKEGKLLKNLGSGLCGQSKDSFNPETPLELVKCVRPAEAANRLETFAVEVNEKTGGNYIMTPWSSIEIGEEVGEKCLYSNNGGDDGWVWTWRCDLEDAWLAWDFIEVREGNGVMNFLVKHRESGRCMKAVGDSVKLYRRCDGNDRYMVWTFQ